MPLGVVISAVASCRRSDMAFIVFEGIDGSGKSTLIGSLVERLKEKELRYKLTREPGGTPLAEEIREMLLRTEGESPIPRSELLLYQAARAQHVEAVIRPSLGRKEWVLCDRYTSSTLAFQAGGREINEEQIVWLNDYATDKCYPDLWVLLDLPVDPIPMLMPMPPMPMPPYIPPIPIPPMPILPMPP